MAGKGLGIGLEALFGAAAIEENTGDGTYLPIAKIEPRKDQPRSKFDEAALMELSESIREHGLLQPITVREIDNGYYQIVAGERRWRASRMAGLAQVPVRIIEADDKTAMELALVENLQRENLNPIEEANGYQTLLQEYHLKQEEIAQRVGKSRPVIANSLRLLALPKEVLSLVEDGTLSLSHARIILELKEESERITAAKAVVEKGLTVRQLTSIIKKAEKGKEPSKRELPNDEVDYLGEVEKRLAKMLGRKVKIVEGQKKGRIEIEYYGDDDFEQLCAALEKLKLEDEK